MLKAITRAANTIDSRVESINRERLERGQNKISTANYFDHYSKEADLEVSVTEEDFTKARQELAPSVSLDELRHYERVRNAFEGTTTQSNQHSQSSVRQQQGLHGNGNTSTNGHAVKAAMTNGNGRADDEDDFVIRTEGLSLHNPLQRPPSAKGKGKGREAPAPQVDGYTNDDQDLYD